MSVDSAAQSLRQRLGERLIATGEDGYESARPVWNAAVTTRPALIARCANVREVSDVVRIAVDNGVPFVRAVGRARLGGPGDARRRCRP